jgi:hypothetical protein
MRTRTIVWLLIATFLVVVGSILFLGVMMKLNWNFTRLATTQYKQIRHEISEEYENISIVTNTSDIELLPSETDQTLVVCYEETNIKHSVTVKDGTLFIEVEDERKWYEHISINWGSPKLTVYLPAGEYGLLSVKVTTGDTKIAKDFRFESMNISASTGDIKTAATVQGFAKLKTTTGDIRVENSSVGSLGLSVTTGDIAVYSVACEGEMTITVDTGDAKLTDVSCESLYTNGDTGDLNLKNTVATGEFSIKRNTGDVKLDGCDAAELFIETTTGDVKGSLLSEKVFIAGSDTGSVKVPESTSGGKCKIHTNTGDIKITVQS